MIRRPPRSTLFPYTRSSDLASMRWSGCCRRRERADRRKRKRLKSRSEHQNQTDLIAGKGLVANDFHFQQRPLPCALQIAVPDLSSPAPSHAFIRSSLRRWSHPHTRRMCPLRIARSSWRRSPFRGRAPPARAPRHPTRSSTPSCCWTCPRPLRWYRGRCSRSEEHTSELQSQSNLVCRLLLAKKKRCSV